jgi:hypothetical protein
MIIIIGDDNSVSGLLVVAWMETDCDVKRDCCGGRYLLLISLPAVPFTLGAANIYTHIHISVLQERELAWKESIIKVRFLLTVC